MNSILAESVFFFKFKGVHRFHFILAGFPRDLLIFTVLLHTFGYFDLPKIRPMADRSEFINPHCTDEREDVTS